MRLTLHRSRRLLASVSLSLALCCALPSWSASAPQSPAARPAADFTLATAKGKVTLHDLRGKVVLIDFWASWCVPCRQSFPWLDSVSSRYAANDFVVVAINLDKRRDLADKFLREFAPSFTVAFDPAGRSAEEYAVAAMPSSFLVGRDGQLLDTHAGFDLEDTKSLEKKIQEALAR